MFEFTEEEEKAIRSLQRVAKKWPKSLVLFVDTTSLSVFKADEIQDFDADNNDLCLNDCHSQRITGLNIEAGQH